MKIAKQLVVLTALTAFALAWTAHATESDKEKQQHEVRSMAQDTLQRLYKAKPKTKAAVSHAYGYAVFSNLGVKILVAGSGNGKGLAVNNKSKRETFMKMLQVQAGLGMGVKKFRVVFVFDNEKAFDSFVNSGWQLGGQSTAAAKTGGKGESSGWNFLLSEWAVGTWRPIFLGDTRRTA